MAEGQQLSVRCILGPGTNRPPRPLRCCLQQCLQQILDPWLPLHVPVAEDGSGSSLAELGQKDYHNWFEMG